jgi:hypothetical protein
MDDKREMKFISPPPPPIPPPPQKKTTGIQNTHTRTGTRKKREKNSCY